LTKSLSRVWWPTFLEHSVYEWNTFPATQLTVPKQWSGIIPY